MRLADLVSTIKKRPELYITARSINYLRVYIDGYISALEITECEDFQLKLVEFQVWVAEKYQVSTNQSWNQIILFFSSNENVALDRFFELFEEFVSNGSHE